MKEYVEIPFNEFINDKIQLLVLPLTLIGCTPMMALQDITKTKEYRNASPAQLKLLKVVDYFWYRIVYWIIFYRTGILDKRLKPLSLKEFRGVETFGKLYAEQLNLTIQYHAITEELPVGFPNPLAWWTSQILDVKNDWYYSVFYPSQRNKTESLKILKQNVQTMKGKNNYGFSNLSKLSEDLFKRLLRLSMSSRTGDEIKYFRKSYEKFIEMNQQHIEQLANKDKYGRTFQTVFAEGEHIFMTQQNKRKKILH